jgi:hypothetical protein
VNNVALDDRLYAEAQERARVRAREYWSKPQTVLTPEQEQERHRQRVEFARFSRCRVEDVVWHGPDQCWTFR